MTNQDIINKVSKTPWITWEERNFIMANYRKAPSSESDNWTSVCVKGSDFRYGSFKIDPKKMLTRGETFDEFYKNRIVD